MSPASGTLGDGRVAVIVGAGLAGSLLACYLARHGFAVRIYERRSDPRAAGFLGGRSINLALSARGLWGLAGIGLDKEILTHALPMRGRMMHPEALHAGGADADLPFQPYSHDSTDAINSISRSGLNLALIYAAARHPNVAFHFEHRCLDIDPDACSATFQHEATGAAGDGPTVTAAGDLLIGADGAFSPVRGRMQKLDRFEYSQSYLSHGYKELHIPAVPPAAGKWGGFALDPGALHIWPRGRAMMIALPNPDKTFTCTLFWPFEGDHAFANLRTREDILAFFRAHYPDAAPLMPTLADDFLRNPTSSLVTVRCWPWVHRAAGGGAVVLMGDAAHAIVPFFGQGINAGFEDVRVFSECLERQAGRGDGWIQEGADEYQRLRKPNADAIARMAVDNFTEMRDKVGSRSFLYRKKLEHFLHDFAPRALMPKYHLVSFTTVPYAEALRRGTRIDRLVRLLLVLLAIAGAALLMALRFPAWALLIAIIAGAGFAWDRSRVRDDTRT